MPHFLMRQNNCLRTNENMRISTKDIIEKTEIAEYINEIGIEFQKQYGEQYYITPQLLWMIYGEKARNIFWMMHTFGRTLCF